VRGGGRLVTRGDARRSLPRLDAMELERREVIGRGETEDRAKEREPRFERSALRGLSPEAVPLALEGEIRVRDALAFQGRCEGLRLRWGHDPVLEPLQDQDRHRDLIEEVDR
jgi:hypothetical protein